MGDKLHKVPKMEALKKMACDVSYIASQMCPYGVFCTPYAQFYAYEVSFTS